MKNVTKRFSIRGLVAGLLAVAVAPFIVSSPASAYDTNWATYSKTSKWTCTPYATHISGITAESCIVISGMASQAVLIMTNRSGYSTSIEGWTAAIADRSLQTENHCPRSTLSNGYSRACFDTTLHWSACGIPVQAQNEFYVINTFNADRKSQTRHTCSS